MTKHLDSLRVQNFRCFKDFTAEKLGDVNLIVGKNNSGKSTVLEAVFLYVSDSKATSLYYLGDKKNEILSDLDIEDLSFIKNFYHKREFIEQGIVISEKSSHEKYLCMQYGSFDSDNKFVAFTNNVIETEETFNKIFKPHNIIRFSISDRIIYDIYFDNRLRTRARGIGSKYFNLNVSYVGTEDIDFNILSQITDNIHADLEYKKIIIDTLKFIEPTIEDFTFTNKNDSDKESVFRNRFAKLKLNNGDFVPLKSMGDGISTIFNILINAYNAKDGILLIDEVENGLHFSVQKQVWQVLFDLSDKLKMQIFATTHSWDAIEAFAQVAKENTDLEGILMRMGRSARTSTKDNIIATIYDEDRLFDITQQEIEVR